MQYMKAQMECIHIAYMFFCSFDANLYTQSMLINKISASQLSRKFIKSALLVGKLHFLT